VCPGLTCRLCRVGTMRRAIASLSLLLAVPADLTLPSFFADNMALQRAPFFSRIWGWAPVGIEVTVALDDMPLNSTIASGDGSWELRLPPQRAGSGHILTVTTPDAGVVRLQNVAFGELWLCAGQSNMQFAVADALNSTAEISDAVNYPQIRLFTAALVSAGTPAADVASKANYTWTFASHPDAFSDGEMDYPSAVCYFTGRDLFHRLRIAEGQEVPVGLVAVPWGGVKIETCMSDDAIADALGTQATCGGTQAASDVASGVSVDLVSDGDESSPYGDVPNTNTGGVWNGMIAPFARFVFRGALWYQGESNWQDPLSYGCLLPAMVVDWRRKFGLPELAFLYVELAGYPWHDYENIRAASATVLELQHTGFASAMDLGGEGLKGSLIHPRRKQEVGRRLGLAAMRVAYGATPSVFDAPTQGPQFHDYIVTPGTAGFNATVRFDPATASGLHLANTSNCSVCCGASSFSFDADQHSPFEVQLTNFTWLPAAGVLVHDALAAVTIWSPFADVVGFRYAWAGLPQCALYNGIDGPEEHTSIVAPQFLQCFHGMFNKTKKYGWGPRCANQTTGIVIVV